MKTDAASFKRADLSLDRVRRAAAAIAGILVGGRIVGGFKRIVTETVAAADSVVKTSEKLGVGAQALQEYQFAAQKSGVQIRTFNMGLQRFARRTAEAAKGTGEAKDALREMGIQLRDNQGKLRPADDLLLDVADSISKVSDEGEKVRLAFKLFDSEGVSLINMLKGGSDALSAMRQEARDTGGVFSEEFLNASAQMTNQLLRLKMSTQGLKVMFVNALFPALNAGIEWFMDMVKGMRETLKGTKLLQVALGALAAAATVLVFVLGFKLLGAVGGLALSLVSLAGGFTTAGAAALLMQIKMFAIGAAFVLLAGIILLLAEEIVGAFTGMETAGGRISDILGDLYDDLMQAGKKSPWIEAALGPLKALATVLVRAKDALFALIMLLTGDTAGIKTVWEDLKGDAKGFLDLQQRLGSKAGSAIADTAKGFWDLHQRLGSKAGSAIADSAKELWEAHKRRSKEAIRGFLEGHKQIASAVFGGTPSSPGILPSQQATAAAGGGTATSSHQVTVNQTIQGTSDPATTAKMASEGIREVLREDYKTAKQALTPAVAR
jgi:hypothetical protein